MNITYIGRQVEIHDDMKASVEKKLAKFDRYFATDAAATVTFRKVRESECMEITISAGGMLLRAEVKADTYAAALTRCVDILEGQIRRNKTRLEKQLHSAFVPDETWDSAAEPVEEEPAAFRIRTKRFVLKPMTAEEAILQMNLLGHQFFLFTDADTGDTCVVYKRDDGSYGLILPDKK